MIQSSPHRILSLQQIANLAARHYRDHCWLGDRDPKSPVIAVAPKHFALPPAQFVSTVLVQAIRSLGIRDTYEVQPRIESLVGMAEATYYYQTARVWIYRELYPIPTDTPWHLAQRFVIHCCASHHDCLELLPDARQIVLKPKTMGLVLETWSTKP